MKISDWKSILLGMGEFVLGLIYPERCVFCDRVVRQSDEFVCTECSESMLIVREPYCMKCGKQIEDETQELCGDCARKKHYFDRGFTLCCYNDPVRESMYRLKYKNRQRYALYYGRKICNELGDKIRELNADVLIPIPLHEARYRKRGYNQAELLAREIGRIMEIPVRTDIIKRVKNTQAQKTQDAAERRVNIKNAFQISANDVKLSTAILIDDIYTTGSTVDEAARILKSAGINRIYVLTVAAGGS